MQPARTKGKTKNNFFSLYDIAMLGITNHSKVPAAHRHHGRVRPLDPQPADRARVPRRQAHVLERASTLGLAPLVIGIYFFGSVQLFFIGILGEYIGSIHTQVHKRPLVVERERINFEGRPVRPDSVLPGAQIGGGESKASDYVAAFLADNGVSVVYELAGGMITHLLDSLHARPDVRLVSMHHEQAAAFAAEGRGPHHPSAGGGAGDERAGRDQSADGHSQLLLRFRAGRVHHRPGEHVRAA